MRAGRWVASITWAMVKVLPDPVTPSSTCVRSLRLTPSTSSAIAWGWSPFGAKSDLMTKRWPPSDFSGRGGRCGTQGWSRNSGRPSRSSASSAWAVTATADASPSPGRGMTRGSLSASWRADFSLGAPVVPGREESSSSSSTSPSALARSGSISPGPTGVLRPWRGDFPT